MDGLAKLLIIGFVILIAIGVVGVICFAGAIAAAAAAFFSTGTKQIGLIALALVLGYVSWGILGDFNGRKYSKEKEKTKEYTPLMRAVYKRDVKKVQKLLKKGADPNEMREGLSPLIIACGDYYSVRVKSDYVYRNERSSKIVLLLLEANADPNLRGKSSDGEKDLIPLKEALSKNLREAVESLVSYGVFIDSIDKNTNEPLDFMPVQQALRAFVGTSKDKKEIAKILLDSGANPGHFMYKYGMCENETLIMELLHYGSESDEERELTLYLLDKFVELGCNVNEKNENGKTAMHYCAEIMTDTENIPLAEKLLSYGADVNAQDNKGMTPLMALADDFRKVEGLLSGAEFLVSHGADICMKDNDGKIALDYLHKYDDVFVDESYWTDERKAIYYKTEELLTPKTAKTVKSTEPPKTQAPIPTQEKIIAKSDVSLGEHIEMDDIADDW